MISRGTSVQSPEPEGSGRGDDCPRTSLDPLPLFRPELLSKQERFFGEVLKIRPFSFTLLACFVAVPAALIACGLYFGAYIDTIPVQGVLFRAPTLKGPPSTGSEEEASVSVPNLDFAVQPEMRFAIRCLHCPNPAAPIPAIVRRLSTLAARPEKADPLAARQLLEFSYEASASSSKHWLTPGIAVELAFPMGRRRLFELFEPSSIGGKSHS